ncbi:isoaspartyl peptidase/L-asparaginase family protein [Roseivirga sp. BDSF3-8]|uniref:isoaspartyl peptidase/L-asparaginase family protein n=1 Tax=Roseivirga sp. BDSF3-8 TaxID=3241598 RepID=UPI00353186D8
MKRTLTLFLCLLMAGMAYSQTRPVIVIHGGAGTILKENMTPEKEEAIRSKMEEAMRAGYEVLDEGGTSTEAVVATIKILEDSPLFNAGKGAVFTSQGENELDASIMDGRDRNAGAVAGVKHIKNPITAALAVMTSSPHVMLTGEGAEEFASQEKLNMVDARYFYTENRYEQLRKIKEREQAEDAEGSIKLRSNPETADEKFGTVGCLALDKNGNLAAGTSTGGMTNKKYGRVGDSPVIGAGTYADNATCAVSATGHGEYFIRSVAAYDVAAMMRYADMEVGKAASTVVENIGEMGGSGGLIALDAQGNVAMPFNTAGMYRGYMKGKEDINTFIYGDEE